MRGLWKLTWLEIRIFVREPLGFVAAVGIPLAMFLVLGRSVSPGADHSARDDAVPGAGPASVRLHLHLDQRRAFAHRGHLDLPRGRHPQAPASHAAAAGGHPRGACAGQAVLHRDLAPAHGPRRAALLPGAASRARRGLRARGRRDHGDDPVHGLRHRQHGGHGEVRPADRQRDLLPDAGGLGHVRAAFVAACGRGRCSATCCPCRTRSRFFAARGSARTGSCCCRTSGRSR